MNLHHDRNRSLCLLLGTLIILGFSGFLLVKSDAEPIGKGIPKFGLGKNDAPPAGGKAVGSPVVDNDQYTIGPEDVLQINVWHEPEISGLVPVRPDGRISVALIGDLTASGLTPTRLQATLTEKLHAYLTNPEVSVTVQQIKSRNFNVLGEVQKPGTYPLAHSVTVLDAIGMAGGFRDFAKVTKIYVLRHTPGGDTARLPFNYKQVIKGAQTDQNIELMPEDTVVVP